MKILIVLFSNFLMIHLVTIRRSCRNTLRPDKSFTPNRIDEPIQRKGEGNSKRYRVGKTRNPLVPSCNNRYV